MNYRECRGTPQKQDEELARTTTTYEARKAPHSPESGPTLRTFAFKSRCIHAQRKPWQFRILAFTFLEAVERLPVLYKACAVTDLCRHVPTGVQPAASCEYLVVQDIDVQVVGGFEPLCGLEVAIVQKLCFHDVKETECAHVLCKPNDWSRTPPRPPAVVVAALRALRANALVVRDLRLDAATSIRRFHPRKSCVVQELRLHTV